MKDFGDIIRANDGSLYIVCKFYNTKPICYGCVFKSEKDRGCLTTLVYKKFGTRICDNIIPPRAHFEELKGGL